MAERNRFVYMRYNKAGRSTQLDEGTTWFPRKEEGSPRKAIYRNECPTELQAFETCMVEHNGILSECSAQNAALEACGNQVFKKINAMPEPYDYKKGLAK